jgi:hypothetical protein
MCMRCQSHGLDCSGFKFSTQQSSRSELYVPFIGAISTELPKGDDLKDHYVDQQPSTLAAASEMAHKTQHSERHVCFYPGCARECHTRDDLRAHQRIRGHELPDFFPSESALDIVADATTVHDSMPPPSNLAPLTLPPFGFLQASNKHTSPLTPPASAVPDSAEESGQETKPDCNSCRRLKIKCTGGKPCLRCQQTKCLCIYDPWYANDHHSSLFEKVDGMFLHQSPEIRSSKRTTGIEFPVAVSANVPVIVESSDMDIDSKTKSL